MRLFHIKLIEINDYQWTLNHGSYHEQYAKERDEAVIKIAAREAQLLAIGIIVHEKTPVLVNDKQLLDLTVAKVEFEMVQEIPVDEDSPSDLNGVMRKFNRMAQRLLSLPGLTNGGAFHNSYNEKCEVHMPGQALSVYNEVLLLEDSCTDALQESLNLGWRMIAACPQPNNRRPDYILGRFNDKIQRIESSAARSPE